MTVIHMSERWAMLCIMATRETFDLNGFVHRCESIGLALEYADTAHIKILDATGEQHDCSRQEMHDTLMHSGTVTFQLWWNEYEDTCCRIRHTIDFTTIEFWLDGHDEKQERSIYSFLRTQFNDLARNDQAIAIVIDRTGMSSLYPWVDILHGDASIPGGFSGELVVPSRISKYLSEAATSSLKWEKHGEFVVIGHSYSPRRDQ